MIERKTRTDHVLHQPDNLTCYLQRMALFLDTPKDHILFCSRTERTESCLWGEVIR